MTEHEDSAHALLDLVYGSWKSQVVYAFAHFGLADLMAEGSKSSTDLANKTGTDKGALERLLRAAGSVGLVQRSGNEYELSKRGMLLISDSPDSVRHWTLWWGKSLWPVWGNLVYSIETGDSARSMLFGSEGFEHLKADPEASRIFNLGLAEVTRLAAKTIASEYDFSRFPVVMDLGGGYGQLLASILEANPRVQGMLVDLPEAISGAQEFWGNLPAAGRCRQLEGDFFAEIPTGADAVILKSVLHDWRDADAVRILQTCRRHMKPGSSLLVMERLIPDGLEESPGHQTIARIDLTMLVAHGSKERSEADYCRLLNTSGFTVLNTFQSMSGFTILEAQ